MGEVVQFEGSSGAILQTLRAALSDAEAGKVTSLALAVVLREGETVQAFCPGDGVVALLGGLRILEGKVFEHLREMNEGEL